MDKKVTLMITLIVPIVLIQFLNGDTGVILATPDGVEELFCENFQNNNFYGPIITTVLWVLVAGSIFFGPFLDALSGVKSGPAGDVSFDYTYTKILWSAVLFLYIVVYGGLILFFDINIGCLLPLAEGP